ncbi:Glutamate racemase [Rubrivivax sp. A210]|uniref:glutamate racemase n=1 Tax=Rubrivivax sp. A210 TaxID=2772301 RepID=UPI001919F989|nr:glutamate racemase [Rubrivivax sp. A210]CAD5371990.1 Glutamate racemase [Rubrivivax sp. A210]
MTATTSQAPIGIFDSGVGGLSVLAALREAMPAEDFVYVADSGNAPYGDQEPEFIEARAFAVFEFLLKMGARAVVIACNTATAVAVHRLRAAFAVPIVAMEPAIKPAVAMSRSRVVGVLATSRTLESPAVAQLCRVYGAGARILLQPCPGLVERIEAGDLEGESTRSLLRRYITPLLAEGADTLVLGCTHYPFLTPQIRAIAGPEVQVIEPSAAVARQLKRLMAENSDAAESGARGRVQFFTSGRTDAVQAVITALWRQPVDVQRLPCSGGESGAAESKA